MKIVASKNGKQIVKMSKTEWEQMGRTAGWLDDRAKENEIEKKKLREEKQLNQDKDDAEYIKNEKKRKDKVKKELREDVEKMMQK